MNRCLLDDAEQTNKPNEPNAKNICPPTPARHETTFSPQEHLPNELLRYIFVLIAEECGFVTFPFSRGEFPTQLVLSHVCSRWRVLARHTLELWNSIRLTGGYYYTGQPFQEWVLLAGKSTIVLSLGSIFWVDDDGPANSIQTIVLPFKAKILHLNLTLGQLMALSKLPNSLLLDVLDLQLSLTDKDIHKKFSVMPHIFAELESVTLFDQSCEPRPEAFVQHFPLPWSQLRCLIFLFHINDLAPVFAILKQIPALQNLDIPIFLHPNRSLGSLEKLTMPCLRTIALAVGDEDLDKILPHFICPALTNLALTGSASWTDETFEIIKQQYNAQGLHEIRFKGCPLPVSSILRDAPLLRALSLTQDTTTMDDDAVTGISNGTLGRHLRKLRINGTGIVGVVIEMAEMRKRIADTIIENGCNWREAITILTEIKIQVDDMWQLLAAARSADDEGGETDVLLYGTYYNLYTCRS